MPVQITISGENAGQALEELVTLAKLIATTSTTTQTTAPTPTTQTTTPASTTTPAQTTQATAQVTVPTSTTVPTAAPQYDFNQIATATMQLQQAGHNIFEIFQQFGITALNQLPKERYAEYAAVLRQRGAKI